jgi:tetratricopeptide (TPR) repeat protein
MVGCAGRRCFALHSGRIQRHFWSDFHDGRKLLESGHPEEAIGCFERFIQRLRDNPRLAGYVWLGSSLYTRSAEAMAQSNLGAARLYLHRTEEAEGCLRRAIELDSQYPAPWVNLAVLAMLRATPNKPGPISWKLNPEAMAGSPSNRFRQRPIP